MKNCEAFISPIMSVLFCFVLIIICFNITFNIVVLLIFFLFVYLLLLDGDHAIVLKWCCFFCCWVFLLFIVCIILSTLYCSFWILSSRPIIAVCHSLSILLCSCISVMYLSYCLVPYSSNSKFITGKMLN
jgi:hypothetical protein